MKLESAVYAVAGMCFGIILGYVIATQQIRLGGGAAPAPAQASAPASTTQRQAPPLDEARVQDLTAKLTSNPNDAEASLQLANVYFDAEQFPKAIEWYERSVKLNPKDVNANTDLGVSYYYVNRTDEALATFERSLAMDPNHTKTLLNKGIVLAFGKENLKAAAGEWQKVVELAPQSPEGEAARRALEGIAAAAKQHEGSAPAAQ
jgi:tetratricopeptide (TPR) repeat protein